MSLRSNTVIIIGVAVIVGAIFLTGYLVVNRTEPVPVEVEMVAPQPPAETLPTPTEPPRLPPPTQPVTKSLPATLSLRVPFVSQAPFGNWELPFGEACEESSAIMVDHYFRRQPLTAQIMHDKILATIVWQEQNIGHYLDTDAADTLRLLREYFKLKAEIVEDVSSERIKQELAAGNLLIIPFAGRLLDNPYYRQPGPSYHMFVVRGYDRNEFITNDPGTRHGNGFKYTYRNLTNAIHDYNDGDTLNGRKVMIVVKGVE